MYCHHHCGTCACHPCCHHHCCCRPYIYVPYTQPVIIANPAPVVYPVTYAQNTPLQGAINRLGG